MSAELKRALLSPPLLIVASVLLIVGIGLNAIVFGGGIKFTKDRVELRRDLTLLPKKLGHWVQVLDDETLPAEQVHELGTTAYIQRGYVNTKKIDVKQLEGMDKLSTADRAKLFWTLRARDPSCAINVHMAYYTGLVDTVAHIPERCMVGGGFDPVNPARVSLKLGNGLAPLDVKYNDFRKRDGGRGTSELVINVLYFFQVNGDYEWDSITGVRQKLQNLWEKYGYYCKIEMSTVALAPEESQAVAADFLTQALPEMEKLLPDWEAVNGRRMPSPSSSPSSSSPATTKPAK
jgi:hypothetical protein